MTNYVLKLKTLVQRGLKDESGLSSIEYGLLAAGIAVGLWATIEPIGTKLVAIFTDVNTDLPTLGS